MVFSCGTSSGAICSYLTFTDKPDQAREFWQISEVHDASCGEIFFCGVETCVGVSPLQGGSWCRSCSFCMRSSGSSAMRICWSSVCLCRQADRYSTHQAWWPRPLSPTHTHTHTKLNWLHRPRMTNFFYHLNRTQQKAFSNNKLMSILFPPYLIEHQLIILHSPSCKGKFCDVTACWQSEPQLRYVGSQQVPVCFLLLAKVFTVSTPTVDPI